MTPLPKRKLSTRRQGDRRSSFILKLKGLVSCSNCHKPIFPHRVCPYCGYYKGKQVKIRREKKTKKS